MKFNLQKPCKDCPFRTDRRAFLRKGRVRSLKQELSIDQFGDFACHKTVDYDSSEDGDIHDDTQACAGALILLEKLEAPTNSMRVAERLGMYDRTKLDMDAPVFDSWEDMEDACE